MDVANLVDTRRQENPSTNDTWIVGDIGHTSCRADASLRTISETVLFGVNGGLFVPIPYDGDMFATRKKSVVALTHDSVLLDKDTSNLEALTWTSGRRDLDNLLEVFIPGGTMGSHHRQTRQPLL
jgi:hypothetical protein